MQLPWENKWLLYYVLTWFLHDFTICTMVLPVSAYFNSRMSALPSGSELFWCKLWDHAIAWRSVSSRVRVKDMKSSRSTDVNSSSCFLPRYVPSIRPNNPNRMAEQRQLLTGCVPRSEDTKYAKSFKHVSPNITSHTFRRSVAHFAVKLLSTQRMTNWKEPAKVASGTKTSLLDVAFQRALRHCQANEGINFKIAISFKSFCALGISLHC